MPVQIADPSRGIGSFWLPVASVASGRTGMAVVIRPRARISTHAAQVSFSPGSRARDRLTGLEPRLVFQLPQRSGSALHISSRYLSALCFLRDSV